MIGILLAVGLLNAADLSPVAMERECAVPPIALVAAGRARLPVIFADGERERAAALYLAATIRDITGVRPDVFCEMPGRPVTNSPALRIARSNPMDDAFRVISAADGVRFLGRSDFAVYDWCERVLGVRYYCTDPDMPGKTLTRSPGELSVPAVDYADWPEFAYRNEWLARRSYPLRLAKAGMTHPGGVNVHSPHRWFADPELRAAHPDIFALQPDGSRGEMPLLCYGNPETLRYYERRIDEHIAGIRDSGGIVDTNRHVITVSQWDCPLRCECEHCRRLFDASAGVTGSGSPIIWGYFLKNLANWAKNRYPDYLISFLPYLNTCDVPPGLDLTWEGNCEAMLCTMPGLAMLKEPSVRLHEERLICQWARVTGRKVLNWHYGCWPREYTTAPFLYGRTIAEHYLRMAPYEVGSFINGGVGNAVDQLMTYVWVRCLWNPELDVSAVYDEFARRMFGPASVPMRRLIELQERGWERPWNTSVVSRACIFDISYPAAEVAEMKRLLGEAASLAVSNRLASANVAWYAADFCAFFEDEARYRSGDRFPPLVIPSGPIADSPPRDLMPAFGSARSSIRRTTVRAACENGGIRFLVRCAEPNMAGLNRSAAYGELRAQDTLELFLAAATGPTYRLMVDVRGRLSWSVSDGEWNAPGVTAKVIEAADAWTVELFVPFDAIASWQGIRGNVVRWHPGPRPEREWSRLSTLGGKWNQDRDAFTEFDIIYEKGNTQK